MGRTRHKRPRGDKWESHSRAEWKRDDEIELLAWLDYKVDTTMNAAPQMNSFVTHFKNSRHAKYTLPQIERKIKKFWLANHHHAATSWEEIYRLGTKCLPRLPNDFRREIEGRLGTLKDQTLARRLESPRQLRSASRPADSELSHHISLRLEIAETTSPRKRHRKLFNSSSGRDGSRPRKRRDAEDQLDRESKKCSGQKQPKQENDANAIDSQFMSKVVHDSEDDITDDAGRESPTIRLYYQTQSSRSTVDFSQTPQEEKIEHSDESRSAEDQQSVDLGDLHRELLLFEGPHQTLPEVQTEQGEIIRSLRRELSMIKEDCEGLRRQLDFRDDALRVLSQPEHKSILQRLKDNDEEIDGLQKALQNKEWLRTFSTLSPNHPIPLDPGKVKSGMAAIGGKVKRMLSEYDDDVFHMTSSLEGRDELLSLFRRSFALGLPEARTSIHEALDWSNFSFQAIIRTLIASALSEWVFESNLPDVSETPCALLKKYRSHLGLQDGDVALRNLDFAAHASLMEDEFFQRHVIPARASLLADRLIRTLTPLFVNSEVLEDPDDEVIRTWSAKRSPLEEAFESALRIKAQATLSKDLFEMVLYSPGTIFDQDAMVPESMDGGRAKLSNCITSRVKVCLLPSLQVYEDDRKLVDLNNFVKRPNDQRSTAIKLTKAVVVLENVPAAAC